jgi:hypothetical protein
MMKQLDAIGFAPIVLYAKIYYQGVGLSGAVAL